MKLQQRLYTDITRTSLRAYCSEFAAPFSRYSNSHVRTILECRLTSPSYSEVRTHFTSSLHHGIPHTFKSHTVYMTFISALSSPSSTAPNLQQTTKKQTDNLVRTTTSASKHPLYQSIDPQFSLHVQQPQNKSILHTRSPDSVIALEPKQQ